MSTSHAITIAALRITARDSMLLCRVVANIGEPWLQLIVTTDGKSKEALQDAKSERIAFPNLSHT